MKATVQNVVEKGLCIGCGGCAAKDITNGKLDMVIDSNGLYQPALVSEPLTEAEASNAIAVCPFNPAPDAQVANEDVIATQFIDEGFKQHKHLGNYRALFAGHSNEYRASASSGGVATWLLTKLLDNNFVDGVICVKAGEGSKFKYCLVESSADLVQTSKTKYYPVTLTEMLDLIADKNGKFAVTGVPCFIKAIRLRQLNDDNFKDKIAFTVGIFCGGFKTKSFTDYLISKCGGEQSCASDVNYRTKSSQGQASDYSFSFVDSQQSARRSVKMREVGDMWGTGLFKPLACDYCDDLCSELADISLGDAWIQPYNSDPNGTNIIISRSKLAHELIEQGMEAEELSFDVISEAQACLSQKGNINHRRIGLGHRLAVNKDNFVAKKRVPIKKSSNLSFSLVQKQRSRVRQLSLELWSKYQNASEFDQAMADELKKLRFITRINHLTRRDYFVETLNRALKKIFRTKS